MIISASFEKRQLTKSRKKKKKKNKSPVRSFFDSKSRDAL